MRRVRANNFNRRESWIIQNHHYQHLLSQQLSCNHLRVLPKMFTLPSGNSKSSNNNNSNTNWQLLLNLQPHRRVLKWKGEAPTAAAASAAGTIQRYTQTNPCTQARAEDAAQVLNWGGLPPARPATTTTKSNHQNQRREKRRKKETKQTTHLRPLWHALGLLCRVAASSPASSSASSIVPHRNMRHDSGIKLQKRCKMPKCSRGPDSELDVGQEQYKR